MQRSLKHLKDNGWTVAIVEKWKKFPGMKFGVRQDVWNFGDVLACRPPEKLSDDQICRKISGKVEKGNSCLQTPGTCESCPEWWNRAKIALVQTTDHSSFAKHKLKILAIPEFQKWKDAGGIVLLHGWGKRGPRGKRKVWTLREEQL